MDNLWLAEVDGFEMVLNDMLGNLLVKFREWGVQEATLLNNANNRCYEITYMPDTVDEYGGHWSGFRINGKGLYNKEYIGSYVFGVWTGV